MWTNLGYWIEPGGQRPDAYVIAARELARRVGFAARLTPDDVVVDYACGYGDSLRLWIEEFGVRHVIGVEPDPDVCRVVESRVSDWGLADRIRVHRASAEEPMPASLPGTAAVSVDAPYHFRTRASWLRAVASWLPAGGRVAFSDLLWLGGSAPGVAARGLARGLRIEPQNLGDAAALHRELIDAGLQPLTLDVCGTEVLDGFAAHAARSAMALRITRFVLAQLRARGLLDYAVTAAIQPIAPRSAIRG